MRPDSQKIEAVPVRHRKRQNLLNLSGETCLEIELSAYKTRAVALRQANCNSLDRGPVKHGRAADKGLVVEQCAVHVAEGATKANSVQFNIHRSKHNTKRDRNLAA